MTIGHIIGHVGRSLRDQLIHWTIVAVTVAISGFVPDHWIEEGLRLLDDHTVLTFSPSTILGVRVGVVVLGLAIATLVFRRHRRPARIPAGVAITYPAPSVEFSERTARFYEGDEAAREVIARVFFDKGATAGVSSTVPAATE
jgi:hypothetical protein